MHLERDLSVPQIDLSARADKNGHFVCVSAYLHTKNMILQNRCIDKKIKMVREGKTFAHHPMCIYVAVYFLKKSQPDAGLVVAVSTKYLISE